MYHLAKSLYMQFTAKPEYSILLLGLDNAGKTTFLNQIKALYNANARVASGDPASEETETSLIAGNTVPTVGQNVAVITLPEMYLKVWDVGGQMSLRKLWNSYYGSAHAVVFLVDSTDLGSDVDVEKLKVWPGAVQGRKASYVGIVDDGSTLKSPITPMTPGMNFGRLDECRVALESVLSHEEMAGIPILVLANKQDREDCVEVVRIKEGFVRKVFEGEKGGMVRDSRVLPVSALRGTGVKDAVEWVRSRVVWNKDGRPPVMR